MTAPVYERMVIMLPYFPDGCYHKFEIPWYHNSPRQNIQDRVDAYFNR